MALSSTLELGYWVFTPEKRVRSPLALQKKTNDKGIIMHVSNLYDDEQQIYVCPHCGHHFTARWCAILSVRNGLLDHLNDDEDFVYLNNGDNVVRGHLPEDNEGNRVFACRGCGAAFPRGIPLEKRSESEKRIIPKPDGISRNSDDQDFILSANALWLLNPPLIEGWIQEVSMNILIMAKVNHKRVKREGKQDIISYKYWLGSYEEDGKCGVQAQAVRDIIRATEYYMQKEVEKDEDQ